MKLVFLYHPVKDLKESITFYREILGFEEAWREGDKTVAFNLPDSEIKLMIEDDEQELSAGGIFLVDSVDEFYKSKKDTLVFLKEPVDIPPGRYAIYKDESGNPLRIIDFTKET
ncbi:VOC family protein [Psychrobacillus sp. FJAT-51614]|uniref:VOC family protein n=1 Tax=Psychrobacillus mangrovi TaxID=3117745 RepID=A0ABU8F772_9BACI